MPHLGEGETFTKPELDKWQWRQPKEPAIVSTEEMMIAIPGANGFNPTVCNIHFLIQVFLQQIFVVEDSLSLVIFLHDFWQAPQVVSNCNKRLFHDFCFFFWGGRGSFLNSLFHRIRIRPSFSQALQQWKPQCISANLATLSLQNKVDLRRFTKPNPFKALDRFIKRLFFVFGSWHRLRGQHVLLQLLLQSWIVALCTWTCRQ